MPLELVLAGQVGVVVGYWIVFWVMKTNSFAGSTIQVEAEQLVIENGPYAWVRHPMYLGMIATALSVPFALGSYVAAPVFAMIVPTLILRLVPTVRAIPAAFIASLLSRLEINMPMPAPSATRVPVQRMSSGKLMFLSIIAPPWEICYLDARIPCADG